MLCVCVCGSLRTCVCLSDLHTIPYRYQDNGDGRYGHCCASVWSVTVCCAVCLCVCGSLRTCVCLSDLHTIPYRYQDNGDGRYGHYCASVWSVTVCCAV